MHGGGRFRPYLRPGLLNTDPLMSPRPLERAKPTMLATITTKIPYRKPIGIAVSTQSFVTAAMAVMAIVPRSIARAARFQDPFLPLLMLHRLLQKSSKRSTRHMPFWSALRKRKP